MRTRLLSNLPDYYFFNSSKLNIIPNNFIDSEQLVYIEVKQELRNCKSYYVFSNEHRIQKHTEFVTVYILKSRDTPNTLYGFSFFKDLSDIDRSFLSLLGVGLMKVTRISEINALTNAILHGRADASVYRYD